MSEARLCSRTNSCKENHCETTLGNIKVTNLDFTDNIAMLSEYLDSLVAALSEFSSESLSSSDPLDQDKDSVLWRSVQLARTSKSHRDLHILLEN